MQPANNSWRYAEDGLVIGSKLTMPDLGMYYLPVMNLSDKPRALPGGTRIGDVYPSTSLRQACEMFLADPLISDWESDDHDELLLDMRRTTATGSKNQGVRPRSNLRMDPRMEPNKLPEHSKPLMEYLAEDLTARERERNWQRPSMSTGTYSVVGRIIRDAPIWSLTQSTLENITR